MLARLDDTYCSAQAKSRNGMTQYVTATTAKCNHTMGSRGRRARITSAMTPRVMAPKTSLAQATCPKLTPVSATFMNRKLAPQTSPIAANCSATFTSRRYRLPPTADHRESDEDHRDPANGLSTSRQVGMG